MDIEAIYAAIVDGSGDGGDLSWTRRRLQHLALERAKTPDADVRLGALRVGALLGSKDGLAIAHELVTDPDPRVRTIAYNQVVAARDSGLPGIRKAAGGADPEIAMAAFDLLIQWVDVQSMPLARRSLGASDPRIRLRAATLLGHVSGPGVIPDLQQLVHGDPDESVRQAAHEAISRISGDLPKAVRQPWWDDAELVGAGAMRTESIPAPAPRPVPPAQDPALDKPAIDKPAREPAQSTLPPPPLSNPPALPHEPQRTAAPESALPVPVSSPAEQAPEQAAAQEGQGAAGRWASLPRPLPTETRALVRLLGMVAPEDRGEVLDALQKAPPAQWSDLVIGWSAGADPALGRGLAWSAQALGRTGAVSKMANMLSDPDASVRVAATEAIGELGAIGMIPVLSRQIADKDAMAGAAAVRALVALALRVGRPDLARDQLARVGAQVPEPVAQALSEVRALLTTPEK